MLAQQSSLEVVGAQLQHILASILASLQSSMHRPITSLTGPAQHSTAAAGEVGSEQPLVDLVLRLTVGAPTGLHAYLRDVEPLLPLPALDAACRFGLLHLHSAYVGMHRAKANAISVLSAWLAQPKPRISKPIIMHRIQRKHHLAIDNVV